MLFNHFMDYSNFGELENVFYPLWAILDPKNSHQIFSCPKVAACPFSLSWAVPSCHCCLSQLCKSSHSAFPGDLDSIKEPQIIYKTSRGWPPVRPSANVPLAILVNKLCVSWFINCVFSSFPQRHPFALTSVDKTNGTTPQCLCQGTEAANAFSGSHCWPHYSHRQLWSKRQIPPVLLCIPNPSVCSGIFLYLPAFALLTSSTGSGHHSVGHPESSWMGALAALHLLVSQLMGSWQPFSLWKDGVQAALWCCQTMISTGLPADSFALSPWE